jgi:anaerobic magnesium-protoporphyrin IX monomethyl ester cyclase
MKVLLIRPPHNHMIRTNIPKSVEAETGMYPPLGLLYVAAGVKTWTGAELELLDTPALKLNQTGIREYMSRAKVDVVGIQTMTFNLVDAIETVKTVKAVSPETCVVLGGPHVNLYPKETLTIEGVDALVLGEGERAFADMINAMASGTEIADVEGVAVLAKGQVNTVRARALEPNLDDIPQADRDVIDNGLYWSVLAKRNPVTTMMTSRGCPYKCIFCDRPHLGKSFRYRSAGDVVDEMEDCLKRGIAEIFLYDDTFTIKRERIFEIRDEIKRRNLKIGWDVRARANTLDDEVIKAMKDAGVVRVHIGVESGSPRILKVLKKGITLEQAYTAFKLCKKHGITSLAYFMFGNPTETEDDIEMTMKFIRKCKADYAHISMTTPFPGTELYSMGLKQGLFKEDYWQKFAANPDDKFIAPAWTENFTQEQLEKMRQKAYRVFYTKPGRLIRELFAVRSFGELNKKARLGLSLLFGK